MLKWTTKGVEGIKALITEINNYAYTNLEVLDLTGTPHSLLLTRSPHGRRRRSTSRPSLFSRLVAGKHLPVLLFASHAASSALDSAVRQRHHIDRSEHSSLRVQVSSSSGAAGSRVFAYILMKPSSSVGRRLSSKEVEIFNHMQLEVTLFTSTSLDLANLNLVDNFLVQFCGYMDYLITGDVTTIRKLFLNRIACLSVSSIDNRFKSRGVMKLASLMADGKLPNLEILNLENNEIDEESTHFLSCSITSETVPNLQEFLIGGNPIGDKGVTHLFRYFRKNKVNFIKRLCLNGLWFVEGMMCRDSDGV